MRGLRRRTTSPTRATATGPARSAALVLPVERPPFEMDLRPETRWEARDVERGRAIDLVAGRPAVRRLVHRRGGARRARTRADRRADAHGAADLPPLPADGAGHASCASPRRRPSREFAEIRRVLELCTDVSRASRPCPRSSRRSGSPRLARRRRATAAHRPRRFTRWRRRPGRPSELAALQQMRARRTKIAVGASGVRRGAGDRRVSPARRDGPPVECAGGPRSSMGERRAAKQRATHKESEIGSRSTESDEMRRSLGSELLAARRIPKSSDLPSFLFRPLPSSLCGFAAWRLSLSRLRGS